MWRRRRGRCRANSSTVRGDLFELVWRLAADGALAPAGHEALMRTWTRDGDLAPEPRGRCLRWRRTMARWSRWTACAGWCIRSAIATPHGAGGSL
ncbi:hypothetical protein ACU4GD_39380 [Cupriavidus basilensis]